jgi:hypothetical protein
MSANEPRDDEILGRALSRAIETARVTETPYERSRMAAPPVKPGVSSWRVAALAACIMIAAALGSTLLERPAIDEPVGVQPSARPSLAPTTPQPTASPMSRATTAPTAVDHQVIYFARDGLPPIAARVDVLPVGSGISDLRTLPTAAERIGARMHALIGAGQAPIGTFNAMPPSSAVQGVTGVQVEGDLARIDLVVNAGNWQVSGAARSAAVLQQLVYTATEEPGIRRVLITENGGKPTRIDQLVIDKPLSREDVFGYAFRGAVGIDQAINGDGGAGESAVYSGGGSTTLVEVGTLVRFTSEPRDANGQPAKLPRFTVWLDRGDDTQPDGAKYTLTVLLRYGGGQPVGSGGSPQIHDQTPLRAARSDGGGTQLRFALDDARPWRAFTEANGTRLVVEIGGDPRAVSDRIAVYSPSVGVTVATELRVRGAARVFEANVSWRLKDRSQKVLASGQLTASLGTSAAWGTFERVVALPPSATGNVTLELYEASARDGSELGLVSIPLTVTAR